jgi:Uma2 family endonuclease
VGRRALLTLLSFLPRKAMLQTKQVFITEEEYLAGELDGNIKHEYVDGEIYAMAGASKNHQRIAINMTGFFNTQLANTPCEPFSSDLKVKVGSKYFYPDVMIVCDDDEESEYYTKSPTMIVEVLSRSTRRMDETTKKMAYQTILTLQEYVLIEQDVVDVEVCKRSEGWISKHYFMGDELTIESLNLTLSVEDIYRRVNNEDVSAFYQEQERLLGCSINDV